MPITGARRMMKIGFTDWSVPAVISVPKSPRSVKSRANRFIDEPACSNPDQNMAAPKKRTAHTPTLIRSTLSRQTNTIVHVK